MTMSDIAKVLAFDPGGTTGWCAMGVHRDVLLGASGPDDLLHKRLEIFEYGQIDCGTRHGETGIGMHLGHGALNLPGENRGVNEMITLAMSPEYHDAVVVIEDFILERSERSRDLLSPVRITSSFSFGLSQVASREHMGRVFLQNRSLVKTTCTNDRLRRWALYDEHSGDHARDATRHAYYFLRDCRGHDQKAQIKRHYAWDHFYDDPVKQPAQFNKNQLSTRPKKVGQRVNII